MNEKTSESPKSPCEIKVVRDDTNQVTGVEVVCETPEDRSTLVAAIEAHEIVVKTRPEDKNQDGD